MRKHFKKSNRHRRGGRRNMLPPSVNRKANFMSGFPRTQVQRLTYAVPIKLALDNTGTLDSKLYRANGAWDPDYAAGGTTPFNWGVWQSQYNHYVVLASKIKVTVNSCSSDSGAAVGVYLADDNSVPYNNSGDIVAARRGTYRLVPPKLSAVPVIAKGRYSARIFYNVVDVQDARGKLGAKTDNLPTDQALFWVWASTMGGEGTLTALVEVVYTVMFQEPKDVDGQQLTIIGRSELNSMRRELEAYKEIAEYGPEGPDEPSCLGCKELQEWGEPDTEITPCDCQLPTFCDNCWPKSDPEKLPKMWKPLTSTPMEVDEVPEQRQLFASHLEEEKEFTFPEVQYSEPCDRKEPPVDVEMQDESCTVL